MQGAFSYYRMEDPQYIEIKKLLDPIVADVKSGKENADIIAISLMYKMIIKIPLNYFKDSIYTKQVLTGVKWYLKHKDFTAIKITARKRKTDRLQPLKVIACDCLEYFAFLPVKLSENKENIHRYIETMDSILWLLKKYNPKKKYPLLLSNQIKKS